MATDDYREAIRTELRVRFSTDGETLDRVLDRLERARRMEELAGLHWEDPAGIAEDIESFSRGYGLRAGWNTWIGIQRTDTSHLYLDAADT
jgi:hypothetical protein